MFILVAILRVAVVLTYLVVLDRSFTVRTDTFCVAGTTCRVSSSGDLDVVFLKFPKYLYLEGVFSSAGHCLPGSREQAGVGVVGLPLLGELWESS